MPFRALYDHWERTRWSLSQLDYTVDRTSFEALDAAERLRLRDLFAHRYDGESTVARLLTPFVSAAPDAEVELLMATQLVDELRHVRTIVRIYEEVFGIDGGAEAVQALADAGRDPITAQLYAEMERWVRALADDPGPDTYLRAVTAYHLLGEGAVAWVSTRFAERAVPSIAEFPGILAGQVLVCRDESRHIGIGVTYARRELVRDRNRALACIGEVVGSATALFDRLRGDADGAMPGEVERLYGTSADGYHEEVVRMVGVRMRAIGAV